MCAGLGVHRTVKDLTLAMRILFWTILSTATQGLSIVYLANLVLTRVRGTYDTALDRLEETPKIFLPLRTRVPPCRRSAHQVQRTPRKAPGSNKTRSDSAGNGAVRAKKGISGGVSGKVIVHCGAEAEGLVVKLTNEVRVTMVFIGQVRCMSDSDQGYGDTTFSLSTHMLYIARGV